MEASSMCAQLAGINFSLVESCSMTQFFLGGACNFNAWMIFGAFFGDGPFVCLRFSFGSGEWRDGQAPGPMLA